MLYNLVLVIFLANGVEHKVPLAVTYSDDKCVELRDYTRGQIDYLNDIKDKPNFGDSVVEFVDAECVAQKIVY